MMSATLYVLLFVAVELTINIYGETGLIFTSPAVLQKGSLERSCVTLHGLNNVDLSLSLRDDNLNLPLKNVTVQESGCFDWMLDGLGEGKKGKFELQVDAYSDNYNFSKHVTVKVKDPNYIVFIQPDKPIYKPGQTVKFRVLVVDSKMKPRLEPIKEIHIEDPSGIRMMQWRDVQVTRYKGIADLQMLMSEEPVQGEWKITVRVEEAIKETHTFKVEEYVLPKYEITFKVPSYVRIDAETIEGEVCAMYTYGEPVRGHLTMKACRKRKHYRRNDPDLCVDVKNEVTGCASFNITTETLQMDHTGHSNSHQSDIHFSASVFENATGVSLNSTKVVSIIAEPYELSFKPYSPEYFKPGLPYHGKVIVKRPDGIPGVGQTVKIQVQNFAANTMYNKDFTTNSAGEVEFSLPPTPKGSDKSVSLVAQMPEFGRSSNHRRGSRKHPYVSDAYHTVKQWYSPSSSYIQIEPVEGALRCGFTATLNVTHLLETDQSDITLYYTLFSHGEQIGHGTSTHSYDDSQIRTYAPDGTFVEEPVHSCPEGMEWNDCSRADGSHCYASCQDISQSCRYPCHPGCHCPQPNYVLHEGRCIHPNDCPFQESCSGGRVWETCGSPCTSTCEKQPLMCVQSCVGRCQCPIGNPIWHNGQCKTLSECPEDPIAESPPPVRSNYTRPPIEGRPVIKLPLSIQITPEMSPSVKVLLYYVRPNKETVAASTNVNVEPCTANRVSFAFNDRSKYPGDSTVLWMRADPGSVCSVSVVDKSVHILGGRNTLSLSQVLDTLKGFELDENSIPGTDTFCEDKLKDRDRGYSSRYYFNPTYYSEYLDSMSAFKGIGTVIVTDMNINNRPCEVREYPIRYYGEPAAIPDDGFGFRRMRMPGAPGPRPENSPVAVEVDLDEDVSAEASPTVDVRTYFPETWLWDLHFVGDSGRLSLNEELPHTVTEWVGSGFCSNVATGLGISPSTTIKGFQPFFVSLTLPYSVVRGETLKLPVTVFNYLSKCLVVKLTLDLSESYDVIGGRETERCVCGQESITEYYKLNATALGEVDIKVTAISIDNNGACGNDVFMSDQIGVRDAVVRPLLVEAEGREVEYAQTAFMCTSTTDPTIREQFTLQLPADYVQGSERAMISTIGDVMGPSLQGLDSLLRLPTGCGEQTMLSFAPNIYVLQYLTSTNQLTPEMNEKALGFLTKGYQRELTYRHNDGSFSAFGKSDDSGSTWLTAFVVKSFAQSKQFITIDDKSLLKSVNWFINKQMENGCFPRLGRVIHKDMKGGLGGGSNDAGLTAFVLLALLEAKPFISAPGMDEAISEGFKCLRTQTVMDTYSLTLMSSAYALKGGPITPEQQRISVLMRERAITDGGLHWSNNPNEQAEVVGDGWMVTPIHKPKAADVEMTAYMLLAMIQSRGIQAIATGLPVVKWLSAQRNSRGGFASTQDTVLALQALARYATLTYSEGSNLTVSIQLRDSQTTLEVNDINRLVLQQQAVSLPNSVTVEATGTGCALVMASVNYNVATISTNEPGFSLTTNVARGDNCKVRNMNICAKYEGEDGASNMAVITVKMVSGWIPVKDSVKNLKNVAGLALKRYEITMNMVNLYFDELTNTEKCLTFKVEQDVEVEHAKPGYVKVFDYYKTELYNTKPYEISTICGTKEELPILSQDEFDRVMEEHERDPSLIEQVRIPAGPPPRSHSDSDLVPVNEPEIIPEHFEPLGSELVPVNEPEIIPEHFEPLGSENTCPACIEQKPADFKEKFCAADKVYRSLVRGLRNFQVKVLQDYRQLNGENVLTLTNLTMATGCSCEYLKKPYKMRRVLIMVSGSGIVPIEGAANKASLQLDGRSTIFLLPSDLTAWRNIEKIMRKTVKKSLCR